MISINPEVYTSMGLNSDEYELILKLLDRSPTYTELGMLAVMWSEHCGYKYSRPVLAHFKGYKEALEGEGLENAGIVDIGDGLGITMKVESHNHPSAVEPYQGAATGVGGIIRDILTMGARPIAGLNSLRFGPITGNGAAANNRRLFAGVVNGIAPSHQSYLAAGGTEGLILGDGALNYGPEEIVETYYSVQVVNWLWIAPDFQYAVHPGYNRDRGPAPIYALRCHVEF